MHDVAAVSDFLAVREALEGDGPLVPALDESLRREDSPA